MWIHIPDLTGSTSSPFAPEGTDWISPSNWRFQALALSALWRGKPSPASDWSRRCGKVLFLRSLCGQMSEPSAADAGVDWWTASLAASRARPIASPAASKASSTSGICGRQPGASSSRSGLDSCSSRTSPECSRRGLTKSLAPSGFGETYSAWAMRLREDCLRRRKSARLTSASGSSSLGWPTVTVADSRASASATAGRSGEPSAFRPGVNLTDAIRLQNIALAAQMETSNWPTPATRDHKGVDRQEIDRGNARPLNEVATAWSTPRASDAEKGGPVQSFGAGGIPLPAQASQWQTPTVGDVTGGHSSRSGERKGEPLLNEQARQASSLPAPPIERLGQSSPETTRDSSPPSLNPRFVEWLMGWPPGWTNFECSEMALCVWKARMRSALSQLSSAPALPAQLGLFG